MSAVAAAWRAKAAVARHSLGRAMSRSALRVGGMASFAAVTWTGLLVAFLAAFRWLGALDVVGPILLVRLLSLFFFVLFVMLTMSNVLVAFQTLFRSRELEFWAVQPLSAQQVHDVRSLEIATIASWAFVFLGLPLLIAHGLAARAHFGYFAIVPVVLVLFAAIAHEIGMLVVVTLVRAFPGLDMKRLVALAVAVLVPVGVVVARAFRVRQIGPNDDVSELLVHALEGLGRTQYPMLPGYWAAETLRAAAHGEGARAAFFLWTLLVTALFFGLLAREASRSWLVPAQQILRGRGLANPALPRTRRAGGAPSAGPLRALAAKDATLFRREPAQWSQALLVGVLGTVYVLNLRSLPDLGPLGAWGRAASALNAGVVLLLVSTLTTRFAFPLVSLEGRRAWIAFCAPIRRSAIVRQKALLALALTLPFGAAVAALSTLVLKVDSPTRATTIVVAIAGAFALSGLAVGLGALFPSFRDDNPARVVSGFGGTMSFLAGLAYSLVTTVLVGAPSVLHATGRIDDASLAPLSRAALALIVLISLLVGLGPLALGARRLEALEL